MRPIKPPEHPFRRDGMPRRSFTTLAGFVKRCGTGARVREEGAFCKVRTADLRQTYNLPADVLDVIDPDWRVCVVASEKHDAERMSAHAVATTVGIAGGKLYDAAAYQREIQAMRYSGAPEHEAKTRAAALRDAVLSQRKPAEPSRAERLSAAARKAWATRRATAVPF